MHGPFIQFRMNQLAARAAGMSSMSTQLAFFQTMPGPWTKKLRKLPNNFETTLAYLDSKLQVDLAAAEFKSKTQNFIETYHYQPQQYRTVQPSSSYMFGTFGR